MLQINPLLDCTIYSGITVHIGRNSQVWTESKDLAVTIYKLTNSGAIAKDFGLREQMRRAAVSIPSNIAEGEESGSLKKSISYFYISKGSLALALSRSPVTHPVPRTPYLAPNTNSVVK